MGENSPACGKNKNSFSKQGVKKTPKGKEHVMDRGQGVRKQKQWIGEWISDNKEKDGEGKMETIKMETIEEKKKVKAV